jgi:hypothetical protein
MRMIRSRSLAYCIELGDADKPRSTEERTKGGDPTPQYGKSNICECPIHESSVVNVSSDLVAERERHSVCIGLLVDVVKNTSEDI